MSNLIQAITENKALSLRKVLKFYPIFRFLGLKLKISEDYRNITLKLPLRWYLKNNTGVMFGGSLSSASDPFPALLFQKIIPNTTAWTKSHSIKYLRPIRTSVHCTFSISEDDIIEITNSIEKSGWAEKTFIYYFFDKKGQQVAEVTNVSFIKRKSKTLKDKSND
jgi:acyl-coenzyme A thioesterase PaaI-like protein